MKVHAALVAFAFMLTGCASYIPPGEKADLQLFSSPDVAAGFAVQPSNPWPAAIAVVRLQSPGYRNWHLQQRGGVHGYGRYSVVLTRELDEDSQLQRIISLDQVAGLVSLNRMLLPEQLQSEEDLRAAAARVQADLVFMYTFDTTFLDKNLSRPLTAISLGFSRTRQVTAVTTASGLLVDTRTGYIYAVYEVLEQSQVQASAWSSQESADEARRDNEKTAFERLIGEVVTSWPRVLARHPASAALAAPRAGSRQ